jgi:transcriptional regulator GlxA family with amidase domain
MGTPARRIAVLVLPGTFASGVAAIFDCHALTVERGIRVIGPGAHVALDAISVLSFDGFDVGLARQIGVHPDRAISAGEKIDFLWLPAFRAGGVEQLRERLLRLHGTIALLRHFFEAGTVIGASGASVLLAAAAGMTAGKPVPLPSPLLPVARSLFPRTKFVCDIPLANYRGLYLSSGPAHDLDLLSNAFSEILSPFAVSWFRSVLGADGGAASEQSADPVVAAAKLYMEQNFTAKISIMAVARHLGVTHSMLLRRFKADTEMTPSEYLTMLRVETAKRLLIATSRSIDSVSSMVGYNDVRVFRTMFRRTTGMAASKWRQDMRLRQAS